MVINYLLWVVSSSNNLSTHNYFIWVKNDNFQDKFFFKMGTNSSNSFAVEFGNELQTEPF